MFCLAMAVGFALAWRQQRGSATLNSIRPGLLLCTTPSDTFLQRFLSVHSKFVVYVVYWELLSDGDHTGAYTSVRLLCLA